MNYCFCSYSLTISYKANFFICCCFYRNNITWNRLIKSDSGIARIEGFETEDLAAKVAGQVPDASREDGFDPNRCMEVKEQRKVDKFIMYAIDAADQAVTDSGIQIKDDNDSYRTGVLIGSGTVSYTHLNAADE